MRVDTRIGRLAVTVALVAALPSTATAQRLQADRFPEPAAVAQSIVAVGATVGGAAEAASLPEGLFPPAWGAQSRSTAGLAAGGLVGGAVGFAAGGLLGLFVGAGRPNGDGEGQWVCAVEGGLVGAALGESALLPLGVHIANGRRGSYLPALLASAGLGSIGLALFLAGDGGPLDSEAVMGLALVLTPVAQTVASIAIERRTGR